MVDQCPQFVLDLADLVRPAWSDRLPVGQLCLHICTGGDKTATTSSARSPLLPKQVLQCFVNFSQATTGQAETSHVWYSREKCLIRAPLPGNISKADALDPFCADKIKSIEIGTLLAGVSPGLGW